MKNKIRIITISIVILAMLLSGCGWRQSGKKSAGMYTSYDIEEDTAYESEEIMYDTMSAAYEDNSYSAKEVPAAARDNDSGKQKRMIRKSASINIQVMDPIQAAEAIIELTDNMGGFVVSSSSSQEHYSGDIYLPKAELTIRVPAERLTEMLEFIENRTTDTAKYVSNKKIYGVDITAEYVDTNSRLTSLEKTRDKLYEIMETAANAEEALEVYNSIADVESDIEVYKGQIKYMEESVALSSIDIRITSVKPAPTQTVQKWNPGEVIKDAFEALLENGKTAVEFLIYFVIVVIPILVLIAIPIILIVLLIKRLIRKNRKNKTTSPDKAEDVLAGPERK